MPTFDFLRTELLPKHTARVPDGARHTFSTIAESMLNTAAAQVRELRTKEKTGLYKGDARRVLVAQLRDEAAGMFDVIENGALSGVREQLKVLHVTRQTVPAGSYEVARELRDTLRSMPKEDREHAIRSSREVQVADAVLNAPGGGIGLGISDGGKQQLLTNFNEAHRAGLLQQIADGETLLASVSEFRRTVTDHLRESLK